MKDHLQAIATVLSLVNPGVCAMMFLGIEKGRDLRAQTVDAAKAVLTIATVLLIAAFLGAQVLHIFGVSLDVFAVAGGIVLAWIGFSMLRGQGSVSTPESKTGSSPATDGAPSLAPLILFAASPGTITGVITISVAHTGLGIPTTAIVAILTVLLVTWVVLILTARFRHPANTDGLMRDMITRYMGLIVIAMGIGFSLTGLKSFMGGS